MLRRLTGLVCATFLVGASAPSTITLGEIESQDAMALKARLLPPDLAAKVVEGSVQRWFSPTVVFYAVYRAPARAAAPDVCRRTDYLVRLEGAQSGEDKAEAQTQLAIKAPRAFEIAAVRLPETGADTQVCNAQAGYVSLRKPQTLAGYRALVTAMRAAAAPGQLPFGITCEPEEDAVCRTPRAALAQVPLDALFRIELGHYEHDVNFGWHLRHVPDEVLARGGYDAEAMFGATGEDGKSWRIILRQGDGALPDVVMRRAEIIYH
ncbi:MAG: hypothetical protein VX309_05600 [Pseudomonadota bacterium]|nr:hypothetical protein [Pseudomonadota bacterium]MEE3154983.1 hypothetical protein [Pseudomonadota bacterium]